MVLSGSGERVVFVHARPGDEALVAGGTIARLRAEGAQVTVLFGTDAGQPAAAIQEALDPLDVTDWRVVPAASGRSIDDDDRALDAFLLSVLDSVQPTAVVIGTDDDRLRAAAGHAAATVDSPVFVSRRATANTDQRLNVIDVSGQIDQKLRAVAGHPDRWTVADHAAVQSDGTALAITGTETFVQLASRAPQDEPYFQTPTGRVVGVVLGFAMGCLFGLLGTIAHQSTVVIGAVTVPLGLIMALLATTALLVGLRLVLHDRLVVLLCAVGMLGTIFLLSLRSAGGSVLIPAGLIGTIWTVGPALVAALVLSWPKLPARR